MAASEPSNFGSSGLNRPLPEVTVWQPVAIDDVHGWDA